MRSPLSPTNLVPTARTRIPRNYFSLLSLLAQKSEDSPKFLLSKSSSPLEVQFLPSRLCTDTPGVPLVAGPTLPPLTQAQPQRLHALAPVQGQLLPG